MRAILYKELSNKQTIQHIDANQPIYKAFPDFDFENVVCVVNSQKTSPDYILKETDILILRLLPASGGGDFVNNVWKTVQNGFDKVRSNPYLRVATDIITGGLSEYAFLAADGYDLYSLVTRDYSSPTSSSYLKDDVDNRPFLKGATNAEATDKSQPYVCGRALFTPYLLANPFYVISGEDGINQYVFHIFECGFNSQIIKKINIDDVLVKTFSDTAPQEGTYTLDGSSTFVDDGVVEIAQDGNVLSDLTEANYKHVTVSASTEIPKDSKVESGDATYLTYTLDAYAKNVDIAISFPYGLFSYDSNGNKKKTAVTVTPQYSLDDGASWNDFSFNQNGGESNIFERNEPSKELRFVAHKDFSVSDYETLKNNGKTNILIRIRNNGTDDSNITNSVYCLFYQSLCFDANKSSYPAGVLQDGGSAGLVNCLCLEERERAVSTVMALRVKATKINQSKLSKVNIITQGLARIWDGAQWSSEKTQTSNPAAWALEVLTSGSHELSKFSDSELDLESFGELYEYCEENSFHFNYIVSGKKTKSDTLSLILGSCHASIYKDIYSRYAVCIDQEKENAIAVYNSQNIISISHSRTFGRLTDALRIKFTNGSDDLFEEDTYIVMRDGQTLNADSVIKDVTVSGITEYEHIVKYARYMMAVEKLRPKTTTISVGNEGVYFTPMSKILIQDDSLKVGTGSATIKSIVSDGTNITTLVLNGKVTFEDGKKYGAIINCFNANGEIVPLAVKVTGDGTTDVIYLSTEISVSAEIVPDTGNILSFGELSEDGTFEKITTPYLISAISNTGDGYSLTLVNYDEAVYATGTIPDYKSNITQKAAVEDAEIPENYAKKIDVDDALQDIINSGTTVTTPSVPQQLKAVAVQDGIRVSCEVSAIGLRNTIQKIVWTITKESGLTVTFETSGTSGAYYFNRTVDGYLESDKLAKWTISAHAVNVYGSESNESTAIAVDTSSYGTWALQEPIIVTRISDRTITLVLSQPSRSDSKDVYGTIRHRIEVKRPDIDEVYYKPATSLDPYASESNYKDGSGYVECDSVYIQTMPLKGQDTSDVENDQYDISDTAYMFRVVAYNEAGASESSEIVATALCTNIQDIVKANLTAKEEYVEKLSAISSNLGVIKQGSLSGDDNNYWALSTVRDDNGNIRYQGAMRVGGDNEYLKVIPNVVNGVIQDYTVEFKVGNFEVTSTETKFIGEHTVESENDLYNRVYISESKVSIQHRYDATDENGWFDLTKIDPTGLLAKSVLSESKLIITNQGIADRRSAGLDIGAPYLSSNSKIYHFDTNENDQNGETMLTIKNAPDGDRGLKGKDDSVSGVVDFTPAILAYAPYSEIGRSLFGQFSISTVLSGVLKSTVDFWIQAQAVENQTIWKISYGDFSAKLVIANTEPFYNQVEDGDIYYNEESKNPLDQNYYKYNLLDEPYFADGYNVKESTEAPYNSLAEKEYKSKYVYYTYDEETDTYSVVKVTPYNYDELLETGLYKYGCAYNNVKEANATIFWEYSIYSGEIDLRDLGITIEAGTWYHFALVQSATALNIFVNTSSQEIPYVVSGEQDVTVEFNTTQKSFLIDELLIDTTVAEDIDTFIEHTTERKPWGALNDSDDWFIMMAKDTSKIKTNLFDVIYPVGSIYWSMNSANPATLFGGTWKQITDRFIYAAGSKAVGEEGGAESVTLEGKHIPSHSHGISENNVTTNGAGSHSHGYLTSPYDGTPTWGFYGDSSARYSGGDAGFDTNSHAWNTSSDGTHTHKVSGKTDTYGGSSAHENMPPYLVAYCWQRTA